MNLFKKSCSHLNRKVVSLVFDKYQAPEVDLQLIM